MNKIVSPVMLLALFLIGCSTQESKKFNWVTDQVGILTPEEQSKLTAELKALEDNLGSQMAILIIDSLNGETIEEFSLKTANSWGLGRKDYDDGVLITIAMKNRRMRIEVGSGLEKIIKDEIAAQIIREEMIFNFQEGKYYKGLHQAVGKLSELITAHKDLIGQRP